MSDLKEIIRRYILRGYPADIALLRKVGAHKTQQSVFFYHHKCASTFTNNLLAACSGDALTHVNDNRYIEHIVKDYSKRFSTHEEIFEEYDDMLFEKRGMILPTCSGHHSNLVNWR